MRSPAALLTALCALAALVLLALAVTDREPRAFTLGVAGAGPAFTLTPGDEACQAPIVIPDRTADFDVVVFTLASAEQPSPPVDVTVATADGRRLASGSAPGGDPPETTALLKRVDVGRVFTREPLRVCLRNAGSADVTLYGSGDLATRTSTGEFNGEPLGADVALSFERASARSLLSLVPVMFERMALWHAGWVGAWLYWLLAAAVLIGVPALLVAALRASVDSGRE
jgi:hypothetical protein